MEYIYSLWSLSTHSQSAVVVCGIRNAVENMFIVCVENKRHARCSLILLTRRAIVTKHEDWGDSTHFVQKPVSPDVLS